MRGCKCHRQEVRSHRQRRRCRSTDCGPERPTEQTRPGTFGDHRPVECAGTRADQGSGQTAAPSRRTCDDGLANRRKNRAPPKAFPRAGGGVSAALGKSNDQEGRLFTRVSERVGPRGLRKAAGQMRRMPQSGIRPVRRRRSPLPSRREGGRRFGGFHRWCLPDAAGRDMLVPRGRFRQEVVDAGCRCIPRYRPGKRRPRRHRTIALA
jgi:hypothetical protein